MLDERRYQLVCLPRGQVLERIVTPAAAALIRLLVGVELGVHEKPVLQAVDADFRCLLIGHRAEMTEHRQSAPMSFRHHCLQLCTSDAGVRLEGSDAVLGPESNRLTRVLRPFERAHAQARDAEAIQIRTGDLQMRAGYL